MFVFRAFLRHYLSADQGQRMLCYLLNASEARDAFQLASQMMLEQPDRLLREKAKHFTRQWSQIEDYALLLSVCKGQLKTFHDATQRDSKATTRRLDHWRKRLRDRDISTNFASQLREYIVMISPGTHLVGREWSVWPQIPLGEGSEHPDVGVRCRRLCKWPGHDGTGRPP